MAKQSKTAGKKAAAKSAPAKAPNAAATKQGKLHGKKVAFLGTFMNDNILVLLKCLVECHAGKVVEPEDPKLDYLFVGAGRGSKPPAEAAKIQKRLPALPQLSIADTLDFLVLSPEDLLREIPRLSPETRERFWESFEYIYGCKDKKIDLTDTDFAGFNLHGAKFYFAKLGGSNFEKAQLQKAFFNKLDSVRFAKADLTNANLKTATACDFNSAKLNMLEADEGKFEECNFQNAQLIDAELDGTKFIDCDLSKANLSRAVAHKAKFTNTKLVEVDLSRADLRNASFAGADLRRANLRYALLNNANLTGAMLDGADFQGAVVSGAKFDAAAQKKAKNLGTSAPRKAGPKLQELAKAVTKDFKTEIRVDLEKDRYVLLSVRFMSYSPKQPWRLESEIYAGTERVSSCDDCAKLEQAFLELTARWLGLKPKLDCVTAEIEKPIRGVNITELAMQVWAECFGVPIPDQAAVNAALKRRDSQALTERDEIVRSICNNGVKAWNALSTKQQMKYDFDGVSFQAAQLDEIDFSLGSFKNTNFKNASIVGGELYNSPLAGADFSNAKLVRCDFESSDLQGAKLINADLTETKLTGAKLQGADLTGAKLYKTKLSKVQYDDATIWPQGYSPSPDMKWKGKGPRGGVKPIVAAKAGSLDFDTFLKDLGAKVESARMDKAGSMLKAERFQLFAEVKDTGIVGIVKSQSSGDLVYSCRLNADGSFGCCTQNLRPCGGLRGALCKHLLVLIVGLAKAGQLDPATVNLWVDLSTNNKPAIDEEAMSATFLRYKGAESGELDWRPTETIPEDFYAM